MRAEAAGAMRATEALNRDGSPKRIPKVMQADIEHSARWRQEYETIWSACWDWYRGNVRPYAYVRVADPNNKNRTMSVSVNEIKGIVDLYEARTSLRQPHFRAIPRFSQASEFADSASTAINYYWRTQQTLQQFRLAQKFNIIAGHGWMRTSWKLLRETQRQPKEVRDPEIARRIGVRDAAMALNPDAEYQSDDEIRAQVNAEFDRSPVVVAHDEHPVGRMVSIFDVFVDPAATGMHDARWIAQREWQPAHVVANDRRYKRNARKEVTELAGRIGALSSRRTMAGTTRGQSRNTGLRETPNVKWVEIFEYHDLVLGQWCRFAANSEHFLIEPSPSPYHGSVYRSPFEQLRNYEVLDTDWSLSFYPQGEVEQLIGLNWELNETRTDLMAHRRSLGSMYAVRAANMGRELRSQLENPRPGRVVSVQTAEPVGNVIAPIQAAPIQPGLFDIAGQSRFDMARVAGISDLDRGTEDMSRVSATAAAALADAGQSRIQRKLSDAQDAAARVGGRYLMLAQMYLTKEQAVRITGDDGEVEWGSFDRAAILGQYDVEVEHGSMAPRNEQQRRLDAQQLMQMLQPFLPVLQLDKIAAYILSEFGIDNPEQYINPAGMAGAQAQGQHQVPSGAPPQMSLMEGAAA